MTSEMAPVIPCPNVSSISVMASTIPFVSSRKVLITSPDDMALPSSPMGNGLAPGMSRMRSNILRIISDMLR